MKNKDEKKKSVKKLTRVCGSRYHVTDGTAWRRDQKQAGVSVQHPTNHDRSNAGVIQIKGAVGANGSWLEQRMLGLGDHR